MTIELPADDVALARWAQTAGKLPAAWRPSTLGLSVPSEVGQQDDADDEELDSKNVKLYAKVLRKSVDLLGGHFNLPRKDAHTFLEHYRRELLVEADRVSYEDLASELNLVTEILRQITAKAMPTYVSYYSPEISFPERLAQTQESFEQIWNTAHKNLSPREAESDQVAIGRVLTLCVLRAGICDSKLLHALYIALEQPLRIARQWRYVEVSVQDGPLNLIETRRIFADAVLAAAYLALDEKRIDRYSQTCLAATKSDLQRKPGARMRQDIFPCIRAFLLDAGLNNDYLPSTASSFLELVASAFRLRLPSLLVDYAQRRVISTSVPERVWARLNRVALPQAACSVPETGEPSDELRSDEPVEKADGSPQFGDPLTPLRRILRRKIGARAEVPRLLRTAEFANSKIPAVSLMGRWAQHLLSTRLHTGKKRQPGTTLLLLGLFADRFISLIGSRNPEQMQEEDLAEVYRQIADDANNARHRFRIVQAIRNFDAFLRIGKSKLDWQSSSDPDDLDGSAVSANYISLQEYRALQHEIRAPDSWFGTPTQQRDALVIVALGFRFGLRIDEATGLLAKDVQPGPDGTILVRENRFRNLKTSNSRRTVPLALLDDEERSLLESLHAEAAKLGPNAALLSQDPQRRERYRIHMLTPGIKRCLTRATGDPQLHDHHLRHSVPTRGLVALMGGDSAIHGEISALLGLHEDGSRIVNTLARGLRVRSGKGWMLSHLLGHAYPYTTFAHYTHSLDVLLHARLSRDGEHGEVRLVLQAAGYESGSRIREDNLDQVFRRLGRRQPKRLVRLEPIAADPRAAETDAAVAVPVLDLVRLRELHVLATGAAAAGQSEMLTETVVAQSRFGLKEAPTSRDDRTQAVVTLAHLNQCARDDLASLMEALTIWSASPVKNKLCASVSLDKLQKVLYGLRFEEADSKLAVEVGELAYRARAGGKRPVRRLRMLDDSEVASIRTGRRKASGTFWVYVATKAAAAEKERVKSRAAVAWTLLWARAAFATREPCDAVGPSPVGETDASRRANE